MKTKRVKEGVMFELKVWCESAPSCLLKGHKVRGHTGGDVQLFY